MNWCNFKGSWKSTVSLDCSAKAVQWRLTGSRFSVQKDSCWYYLEDTLGAWQRTRVPMSATNLLTQASVSLPVKWGGTQDGVSVCYQPSHLILWNLGTPQSGNLPLSAGTLFPHLFFLPPWMMSSPWKELNKEIFWMNVCMRDWATFVALC